MPESTNPVDPTAVAVMVGVQNGKGLYHLGYVTANLTAVVSILGRRFSAVRVVSGAFDYADKTTYGARVALGVN